MLGMSPPKDTVQRVWDLGMPVFGVSLLPPGPSFSMSKH